MAMKRIKHDENENQSNKSSSDSSDEESPQLKLPCFRAGERIKTKIEV